MTMKGLVGIIQNLRLYSFVDFILLLYILGARDLVFIGGVSLWIFFLLYLEWRHNHAYRHRGPLWLWLFFLLVGVLLFPTLYAALFVLFVFLYTEKNRGWWGVLGPFFRSAQMMTLTSALVGLHSIYVIPIGILSFIRNLLGDFRDVAKDKKEGLKTIPVMLGFTKNIRYIHLVGVLATTSIWWAYSGMSMFILIAIWSLQLASYEFTPR